MQKTTSILKNIFKRLKQIRNCKCFFSS